MNHPLPPDAVRRLTTTKVVDEPTTPTTSNAPSPHHFQTLERCMRGAMDDNDQFDHAQAVALLNGMLKALQDHKAKFVVKQEPIERTP